MTSSSYLFVVALSVVLVTASATCPNACSGHGTCEDVIDFCSCFKGWQGNDCSQRSCPYGLSFIDTPVGDLDHDDQLNSGFGNRLADTWNRPTGTANLTALNPMYRPHGWWERHPSQLYGIASDSAILPMRQRRDEGHFYAICSNRGLCDYSTGICKCFTGYSGAACNRTDCPNECSGHGVCNTMRQMIPGNDPTATDYMLWDVDKVRGCVCDNGYFGADCSLRKCFSNDDPMTPKTTREWKSEGVPEAGEIQIVKVACGNQGVIQAGSTLKLTYTDVQFDDSFTTAPHTLTGWASDALAAADLKAKLEALPDEVLASHADSVKIDSVTRDTQTTPLGGTIYRYVISFNSRLGNVPVLSADDSGLTCSAGVVLRDNWKSDSWNEMIRVTMEGTGPVRDATLKLKLTANTTDINGDVDVGNVWHYSYKLYSGTETESDADWSIPIPFPEATSTPLPLIRVTADGTQSPLGTQVIKAKFTFPAGPEAADVGNDGAGWVSRRTVSPPTYNDADETYEIQFKAPSKAVTVYTKLYEHMDTLPITYQVKSRGVDAVDEWLYVEYLSVFRQHVEAENYTIWQEALDTYNWTASATSAGDTGQPFFNGWGTLGNAALADKYLMFRFEYGDNSGGQRSLRDKYWTVAATPGQISSSGGDADELLFVEWAGATRPLEHLDFHIRVTNPGSDDLVNGTRYVWALNGVNMGEYTPQAGFHTLGGAEEFDDVSALKVRFMHEVQDDDRAGREWYFSTVRKPIQATFSHQESVKVHYRHDTAGSQVTPTEAMVIIINLVSTVSTTDTYRWKLADDDVWYGENNGAGSAFQDDPFQLADVSTHMTHAAELQNLVFWFSGGSDALGMEACDATSSSYDRYYIHIGADGINDFPICSDRGVCDETTGLCKCFLGYAGQDCHEQHALVL